MPTPTSTAKHTEGKWTPVTGQGAHHRDIYIRAGERQADGSWPAVAKCCSSGIGGWVSVQANARLIAAAPDLLQSCKDLRAIIHDYLTHAEQRNCAEAIGKADAILAQADPTPTPKGGAK